MTVVWNHKAKAMILRANFHNIRKEPTYYNNQAQINLNRENTFSTQTPQAFRFKDIYDLSIKFKNKIQDEATLFIDNND